MSYTEEVLLFVCGEDQLLGILAAPEASAAIGIVLVVGGPQYRVGSHRQFVLLARSLAAAGYAVLRFDYRGMGDSTGEQQDFMTITADIAAAIDAMQRQLPSVQRVVLWGLCDAASAALLYCNDTRDARVCGLCLLNPWVRSEASLARTHVKHYYAQRLMQKAFWAKLINGEVAVAALTGLWKNLRAMARPSATNRSSQVPTFQERMAAAWHSFNGCILLLLSTDDYTAKEFLEQTSVNSAWAGALETPLLVRHDLLGADHTFSNAKARTQVELLTLEWLRKHAAS